MPLYLDYSATSPVHPEVLSEMIDVYKNHFGNAGSRTHSYGTDAAAVVRRARSRIAAVLGVSESEVIFTSGATESDNLAILGLAKWGASVGRRHVVSTQIEHKAVLEPLRYLETLGFEVTLVAPSSNGMVSACDVLRQVRKDTLLVSVMHVNNETGVIQPVHEIGQELSESDVYFHIDAAQSFGKLIDEIRSLDYDLLSLSGHKIYGPQGVGALIMRRRRHRFPPLQPLMYGGGQESGFRPGTLPVALIAGMGRAAELAETNHDEWWAQWQDLKDSVLRQVSTLDYRVNGEPSRSMPNIVNLSFPGIDAEALMKAVRDRLGISNGSACNTTTYTPSHVLAAMGLDAKRISEAVRISWGYGLTNIDMEPIVRVVRDFAG